MLVVVVKGKGFQLLREQDIHNSIYKGVLVSFSYYQSGISCSFSLGIVTFFPFIFIGCS